jgi:hypothetical protein
LCDLDLSRLTIRQASLAPVNVRDTSLADSELTDCVLAEAFSLPVSLALSGDGALLAAGTTSGEAWLWRTTDRTLSALIKRPHWPRSWCCTW